MRRSALSTVDDARTLSSCDAVVDKPDRALREFQEVFSVPLCRNLPHRAVGKVQELFSPPERLVVRRLVDPSVESGGFPVRSLYTEVVLLPILGPASVLCLRRLGTYAGSKPSGVEIDTRALARDLGLGDRLTRNSAITRTLNRLCQFDMAKWSGTELAVRTAVAPLSPRHLLRLSPELRNVHQAMLARKMQAPAPDQSPQLGVGL